MSFDTLDKLMLFEAEHDLTIAIEDVLSQHTIKAFDEFVLYIARSIYILRYFLTNRDLKQWHETMDTHLQTMQFIIDLLNEYDTDGIDCHELDPYLEVLHDAIIDFSETFKP